jgi:hypothetical protein
MKLLFLGVLSAIAILACFNSFIVGWRLTSWLLS